MLSYCRVQIANLRHKVEIKTKYKNLNVKINVFVSCEHELWRPFQLGV
jgi:hypothetical protein